MEAYRCRAQTIVKYCDVNNDVLGTPCYVLTAPSAGLINKESDFCCRFFPVVNTVILDLFVADRSTTTLDTSATGVM